DPDLAQPARQPWVVRDELEKTRDEQQGAEGDRDPRAVGERDSATGAERSEPQVRDAASREKADSRAEQGGQEVLVSISRNAHSDHAEELPDDQDDAQDSADPCRHRAPSGHADDT